MTQHPSSDDGREAARDVAKRWASRGMPVFPCRIGWDASAYGGTGGTTKAPANDHGHLEATTDLAEVDRLYDGAKCRPGEVFGCALLPGGADAVVVDIDVKGGRNGVVAADHLGLRDTWGASTPSGGEHRVFWRPAGIRIGNSSPWADEGIDIRGDEGWIVAPGTVTPWGTWAKLPDLEWPADVQQIPPFVLERLAVTTGGARSVGATWRYLSAEARRMLAPSTLEALGVLETLGGHTPTIHTAEGREPWVQIVRPGKRGGNSATIGRIGPGVIKSFTPDWPGVPEGRWVVESGTLAPYEPDVAWERTDWGKAILASEDAPLGLGVDPETGEIHADPDVHELVAREDVPYDWLIPALIERGDRCILTGREGRGKSTLLRQIAIMAAAGIDPFTEAPIPPITVLYVDLENSERQIRRKIRPLYDLAKDAISARKLIFHIRPEGVDLTLDSDRTRLVETIRHASADLLIIGPIYKLHSGDPIEERPAKAVASYLDWVRTMLGCAVLIEAHTPYGGGQTRPERPYGASLWSRWPEFGIFLAEDGALRHWRGQRDEREWPAQLRRHDDNTWPWEVEHDPRKVTFARMCDIVRDLGCVPSQAELAVALGCSRRTVSRAIEANKLQWDTLRTEYGGET